MLWNEVQGPVTWASNTADNRLALAPDMDRGVAPGDASQQDGLTGGCPEKFFLIIYLAVPCLETLRPTIKFHTQHEPACRAW